MSDRQQEDRDLHDIWRLTAEVVTARRERDEARAKLARYDPTADTEYHPLVMNLRAQLGDAIRERDEARALARRLAAAFRSVMPVGKMTPGETKLLAAFDAEPWSNE